MKNLLILLIPILGCSAFHKKNSLYSYDVISDVKIVPQSLSLLKRNNDIDSAQDLKNNQLEVISKFKANFYSVWNTPPSFPTYEELDKEAISLEECYGENYQKKSLAWFQNQTKNENLQSLGKLGKIGIILRDTNLRGLPIQQPCHRSPTIGGEGYPFDYLQYTSLYLGSPVIISHFSKDLGWVFVKTSRNEHGWVKSEDVGFITKKDQRKLEKNNIGILFKDNIPIYNKFHSFVAYLKTGTVLPVLKQENDDVVVQVPQQSLGPKKNVYFENIRISKEHILLQPLRLDNSEDILLAFDQFIGKPYGWGSYLGNRDCSSMIKDFYSLFYLFLPSSSRTQLKYGKLVDVKNFTPKEKLDYLLNNTKPFRTLLYRTGHIGIYAGSYNNQPLMFHALWGIKTKVGDFEGRNLIGKSLITTLEFGKDLPSFDAKAGTFLDNLEFLILIE